MIKRELYKERKDGVKLYRTYSDEEYKIQQVETGIIYEEAIDVESATYTYIETDEKIEKRDFDKTENEGYNINRKGGELYGINNRNSSSLRNATFRSNNEETKVS